MLLAAYADTGGAPDRQEMSLGDGAAEEEVPIECLVPPACATEADDELSFAASVDRVQDVTEQIAEFLINFGPQEQKTILAPFHAGVKDLSEWGADDEPEHIDEARRFIRNYLAIFSKCEQDLILENLQKTDTGSISRSHSVTPTGSLTPPGCLTPLRGRLTPPTSLTPREYLGARRRTNEVYHSASPNHAVA
eukprot:NODE_12196_length_1239_cov_6.411871.p1 GENE.NODE_12196_length_1239_cov_6.411871~~NODE_12196_length_1239_cov_6.411871.p1  ORF type:complete len:203 (-),score=65.79 NODE_12196_length_1239_cov_6.411871:631-1209(-)